MWTYHILQYTFLLLFCSYLVQYYAGKSVSFHIKFWSVITWTLNFAIALLVPEDVYQTFKNPSKYQNQTDQQKLSSLGLQYMILYWLVYILTWTVIPVLQEWENSGDIKSQDRLRRSLRINGAFYLQMLIGAIIFLLILIWFNAGGQMGLITFLKCLATIWGLLLLTVLMGYALVQIPKTLWNHAQPQKFLHYLYSKVIQVDDELQESYQEFTKVVGYINYSQKYSNQKEIPDKEQILNYCSEAHKLIPKEYEEKINHSSYYQFLEKISYVEENPISLESSIEHLRLLKRAIAQCKRLERTFNYYRKKAVLFEDIIQSIKDNHSLQTKVFHVKWYHNLWYMHLRRSANIFCSVIIGIGSVILLISETQVFLTKQSSILGWLLKIKNYQMLRFAVLVVILFIMYMVNYSLFRLKLSNLYGLYYKDSDGPSLMFATVNFSRVGVVIVLNFFDMMKINSEYQKVMGTVDMGLLGQWVIKGLPGVLWLIVLTHYFNFWGRLVYKLKLYDALAFNSHETLDDRGFSKSPYSVLKKRQQIEKQYSQKLLTQ